MVALVITIIALLILAGISIMGLSGKNGLMTKAQQSKIKAQLANAQQEVSLAISGLVVENVGNTKAITPKMIAEQVNSENGRNTYAENEDTFPTNIIYPKQDTGIDEEIQVKIGNNLEVIEVKTASGITNEDNSDTDNNGNSNNGNSDNQNPNTGNTIDVGNVNITITDVNARSFTINVEPENSDNIAMYQYYVNGEMLYEGKEQQYTAFNLDMDTNYQVEVKVVPRTVVSVGNVQQKTTSIPVVEVASKFDKYIYIDSINGNDTNGDGSKEKPYATLDKIADSGIIENGYSYGIILKDGTYELTTKIYNLTCNKSINIIGNKQNTILQVGGIFANGSGGPINDYVVNFYRLIWKNTSTDANTFTVRTQMTWNNVVFDFGNRPWNDNYFLPINVEFSLINCDAIGTIPVDVRCDLGTNKLTNCYGYFLSGYATTNDKWDYATNYITTTPQVNSTTYIITENETSWKNVGTGTNPDGSQANLGVYGGTYSWEFETDLD